MIKEFKFNDMSFEQFADMFEKFEKWYNENYKDEIEKQKKEKEDSRRKIVLKDLCSALDENLRNIADLVHIINRYNFGNEQCVINWMDALNQVSVKH